MTFKDLHLNRSYMKFKERVNFIAALLSDRRLRIFIILLMVSGITLGIFGGMYVFQTKRLAASIVKLESTTQEILHKVSIKRQQAEIPKFEASMKAIGAYHPILSSDACLANVAYCFLQKNKPQLELNLLKHEIQPTFMVQSFNLNFKSSFDYEIFDMLEYIFSTPNKFGYTRLREFEIEQLFEASPIVKGRVVYDQLSLTP